MSTTILDAGVGRQVPITRRHAIRTGALAVLAATVAGLAAPALPALAAPLPPAADDSPSIDRAEALLVELQAILLRLDGRHQTNVGTNLEILACAAELREDLVPAYLAEHPLMIGEGNRICDEMDRQEPSTRCRLRRGRRPGPRPDLSHRTRNDPGPPRAR